VSIADEAAVRSEGLHNGAVRILTIREGRRDYQRIIINTNRRLIDVNLNRFSIRQALSEAEVYRLMQVGDGTSYQTKTAADGKTSGQREVGKGSVEAYNARAQGTDTPATTSIKMVDEIGVNAVKKAPIASCGRNEWSLLLNLVETQQISVTLPIWLGFFGLV